MRYGNCWLWALPRFFSGKKRYLIVRKSRYTFWPHAMLTDDISECEVEEYKPDEPQMGFWSFLMAIIFKGHVRKGKGEE